MVGFSMVLLVGFLAMVIDLGHLYIAKTELQNAADAAALSGARQLNGTLLGVNDTSTNCAPPTNNGAVQCAIATAARNNYDFSSTPVDITIEDIWVGDCPDDGCMVPASSISEDANAVGKTFVKVHTRNRDMTAWFAPIWNMFHVSTYGMAVAGKYAIDVTPVGICQLPNDPTNPNATELGYERGVSYRVSDANPLGPGTMFWIDPIATAPGTCDGNVPDTLPYLCTGKMAFTPVAGQTVYTNTGISVPQLRALDSRLDEYSGGGPTSCDPATAPPDSNIREYRCTNEKGDDGCLKNPASGTVGLPRDWMNPDPTQQSITFTTIGGKYQPKRWNTRAFSDYGVLWSGSRPEVAADDTTDAAVSARWSALYQAPSGAAASYPQSSPYAQSSPPFSDPFASHPTKPGRRILNMTIIDCKTAGGICRPGTVVGIGRFIMQRKANISGDNNIYVEFAGLLPDPLPTSDIRLYR